jgi:hypothetical protein
MNNCDFFFFEAAKFCQERSSLLSSRASHYVATPLHIVPRSRMNGAVPQCFISCTYDVTLRSVHVTMTAVEKE